MKYNSDYHHRRSIRLPNYDYSQSGIYFVTICTAKKQHLFGEIRDGKMFLNQIGNIVAQEWLNSENIRKEIVLDEWIIMPNHFHGLVAIIHQDINNLQGANNLQGQIIFRVQTLHPYGGNLDRFRHWWQVLNRG